MHSFQDLELKTLKKICSKYNLHIKIARYSKLSKEELIPHMEKHLFINKDGKIRISENVVDNVEDELDKLIDELKNKVKEVKEKVIKHQTKKAKKEIQIDDKKDINDILEMSDEKKRQYITKNLSKKDNEKYMGILDEKKKLLKEKGYHSSSYTMTIDDYIEAIYYKVDFPKDGWKDRLLKKKLEVYHPVEEKKKGKKK